MPQKENELLENLLQKALRLPFLKATERLSNGVIADRSEAMVVLLLAVAIKEIANFRGRGWGSG